MRRIQTRRDSYRQPGFPSQTLVVKVFDCDVGLVMSVFNLTIHDLSKKREVLNLNRDLTTFQEKFPHANRDLACCKSFQYARNLIAGQ